VRTTDHFRNDVIGPNRLPDREGITYEDCIRIVREARYTRWDAAKQTWSIWGFAPEIQAPEGYWIRVVTNRERDLLITAHPDRNFMRRMRREGW
jgi:hypothetical protein